MSDGFLLAQLRRDRENLSRNERVLLKALEKAEVLLCEIAYRTSDHAWGNWSGPDIMAHVADHFNTTVKALERRIANERNDV